MAQRFQFFLILFAISANCWRSEAQSLNLRHYTVEQGLASTLVYDVCQDNSGFLWFGTESGLTRFDGTEFKSFTTADGLPANTVIKVSEDDAGRLWLGCYTNGVSYLQNGRFFSAHNDSILAQLTFPSGFFNFSVSNNHHYFYDPKKLYQVYFGTDGTGRPIGLKDIDCKQQAIKKICFSKGRPFAMTTTGICKLVDNELVQILKFEKPDQFGMYEGFENYFFLATGKQLFSYKIQADGTVREQLIHTFQYPIELVRVPEKGRIWIQEVSHGVSLIAFEDDAVKSITQYRGIDNINYVYRDREGILWFTTANNGVFALMAEENYLLTSDDNLLNQNVLSLEKLPNGEILAGDAAGHLFRIKDLTVKSIQNIQQKKRFNRIVEIKNDPQFGDIWLGTDEGIFLINHGATTAVKFNSLSSKSLWIGETDIFYGFSNGACKIKKATREISNLSGIEKVMSIAEDGNGGLWLGKLNGLVVRKNNREIKLEDRYPYIFKGRITGLVTDNHGFMWVATHQNGVAILKEDTVLVRHLSVKDGLTSDICQNIFGDKKGYIWVSTNNGLCKINSESFKITKFSKNDVLPDNDVYDAMVFGDTVMAATAKGISIFKDRNTPTRPDFQTLVTNLTINGVHYAPNAEGNIVVPADSCDLYMHFAALSFRSGGQFQYRYKMRQLLAPFSEITFDNFWEFLRSEYLEHNIRNEDILNSNNLRLGNISPGHYLLTISAISYDGVESIAPARFELDIKPRFFQCLWVQLLIFTSLVAFLWRLYLWQLKIKQRDHEILNEMTTLKLEAFKAQINPHFIFNSINGVQRFFFPPDPAKANEYIALFSSLLRKTLVFSDQTTVSFTQELEFLQQYLELTRLRVGDKFEYTILGATEIPKHVQVPTLLLQPLVENAIVHGFPPDGKALLNLNFVIENKRLFCTVVDNGVGINASQLRKLVTGDKRISKGNLLVKRRIDVLNHLLKCNIQFNVIDRSDQQPNANGTIATVAFDLF